MGRRLGHLRAAEDIPSPSPASLYSPSMIAQASELWLAGLAGTPELAQGALEVAPPCSVLPGRLPGLGWGGLLSARWPQIVPSKTGE